MMDRTRHEEVIERVQQIIASDIRPYIEMDGGTIDFVRYENDVIYVRLDGACGTCPSSTLTLKGGVERTIRQHIPEIRAVEMDGLPMMESIYIRSPKTIEV